jgi:hypothetical protein
MSRLADANFRLDSVLVKSLVDGEEIRPRVLQLSHVIWKVNVLQPLPLLLREVAQPA